MVSQAGTRGMSRAQIHHAVSLDRRVLDELLNGMVRVGVLVVHWHNGIPIFRTRPGVG